MPNGTAKQQVVIAKKDSLRHYWETCQQKTAARGRLGRQITATRKNLAIDKLPINGMLNIMAAFLKKRYNKNVNMN